jgi:hypothetical protein
MYSFGKPSTDAAAKPASQTTPQSSYFPFTASTQGTQSTQPMSFFAQVQQTAQQSQQPQLQTQPQQSAQQLSATSLFSQPTPAVTQQQSFFSTPSTQSQQAPQQSVSTASSFFSQPSQQSQTQQAPQQSASMTNSFFSQPPQQSQTHQPLSTASSFFPPPTTQTQSFFSSPAPTSTSLSSTDVNQLLTKIVDLQSQTLKLQEQMQTSLSSLTNQSKVVFNRTCDGCNSIAIIGEIHTALNHCVYDLCSDCYKTKKPPGAIFVTVTTTEALEYLLTMQKIIPTK